MSVTSEELFERYGAAIVAMARALRVAAGGQVSHRDLVTHGVMGMLEAVPRFDPSQGAQFWTFAFPRVRGAMVDAIRAAMPLPKSLHVRLVEAEIASRSTAVGGAAHHDAERRLADAKEAAGLLTPGALAIARGETVGVDDESMSAMRALPHASDRFSARIRPTRNDRSEVVVRAEQEGADEQLETAVRAAAIRDAMRHLTIAERMIVRGLYFEDRCLTDLGAELGVSKSWASRIHSRALARLEEVLAPEWGYQAERARREEAVEAPCEGAAEAA